jgi:hypothetical protein
MSDALTILLATAACWAAIIGVFFLGSLIIKKRAHWPDSASSASSPAKKWPAP